MAGSDRQRNLCFLAGGGKLVMKALRQGDTRGLAIGPPGPFRTTGRHGAGFSPEAVEIGGMALGEGRAWNEGRRVNGHYEMADLSVGKHNPALLDRKPHAGQHAAENFGQASEGGPLIAKAGTAERAEAHRLVRIGRVVS